MWFDPYKLLASANFQEAIDLGVDPGGGLGDPNAPSVSGAVAPAAPINTTGPTVAPTDALSPAAAPATPPPPFTAEGFTGYGGMEPTFYSSTPGTADTSEPYSSISGATSGAAPSPTTPAADTGYKTEADKITGATPSKVAQPGAATLQPTAGTVGGAAGANAVTQFANALRGVAQAAQQGNPQAQQIMNLLRQMQMQGMMGQGMMGGGQNFNPYMSQFNNPWAARHRMEQMRREFMERERLRHQLYGRTPAGGHHGRR